ncbi:hypothetical protein ElyMa_007026400 [Elysia marginata]|uniref:Uncharacterized protein n=1 Tax=Elysia marginata TaxID=1093978 RepID=A0AAV4JRN0_9GAST|nr:hypothetical protein ElyMa_007026400 [Elysia marginata]
MLYGLGKGAIYQSSISFERPQSPPVGQKIKIFPCWAGAILQHLSCSGRHPFLTQTFKRWQTHTNQPLCVHDDRAQSLNVPPCHSIKPDNNRLSQDAPHNGSVKANECHLIDLKRPKFSQKAHTPSGPFAYTVAIQFPAQRARQNGAQEPE